MSSSPVLETNLGTLHLRNPTLLAAGVLGLTGFSLKRVWEAGAGAIVAKSTSMEAREGDPGPNIIQVTGGLLNAMGLPNPGIESMLEEIKIAKNAGAKVIGSIFGEKSEDFSALATMMEEAGVDAVELNLSCPMVKEIWILGHDPKLTKNSVKKVKDSVAIPVFAKLPGNTHISNLLDVVKSAERAGADGITLANTFPALTLDVDVSKPILGHKVGGLSGPAIKPITLRLVYEAHVAVKIPIIGCGGISSANDAIEYLLAGASAVQVGTGIMYKGLEIFGEICEGINSFMKEKGFKEVREMVGLARSA